MQTREHAHLTREHAHITREHAHLTQTITYATDQHNTLTYVPGAKATLDVPIDRLTLEEHGVTCVTISPFITPELLERLWNLVNFQRHDKTHKLYEIDAHRFDLWDIAFLTQSIPTEIDDLVLKHIGPLSCTLVRKSCGILPLLKEESCPGKWHRDTIPLFDQFTSDPVESEYHTLMLPDFYYTVFIPLDVTNKSTEFVLSSHHTRASELHQFNYVTIEHDKTQMLIMNGKLVHRGGMQNENRMLLYMIYCPVWYAEEKYIEF
jgi:hypothetical protein